MYYWPRFHFSPLWLVFRRLLGVFRRLFYDTRRCRRLRCAWVASLFSWLPSDRFFALLVITLPGMVHLSLLAVFFGREAPFRSSNFKTLTFCAVLLSHSIHKHFWGVSSKAFSRRAPWLKETLSAVLKYRSAPRNTPFYYIWDSSDHLIALYLTDSSKARVILMNTDTIEWDNMFIS